MQAGLDAQRASPEGRQCVLFDHETGTEERKLTLQPELVVLRDEANCVGPGHIGVDSRAVGRQNLREVRAVVIRPKWSEDLLDDLAALAEESLLEGVNRLVPSRII